LYTMIYIFIVEAFELAKINNYMEMDRHRGGEQLSKISELPLPAQCIDMISRLVQVF